MKQADDLNANDLEYFYDLVLGVLEEHMKQNWPATPKSRPQARDLHQLLGRIITAQIKVQP